MQELYEIPLAELIADIVNIEYDPTEPLSNIDVQFDRVVNAMHKAALNLPTSRFASHLKPYWSNELNNLKREKMYWFDQWKRNGRTLDDDNLIRINMKSSKKTFHKTLMALSRKYDNDVIADAARHAELDRDKFWRMFKRMKGTPASKVHAVKNLQDEVVYDINSVLEVWRSHFSRLSTPRDSPQYDKAHFDNVTERVREWKEGVGTSEFLEVPFTVDEVIKTIYKMHLKKGRAAHVSTRPSRCRKQLPRSVGVGRRS